MYWADVGNICSDTVNEWWCLKKGNVYSHEVSTPSPSTMLTVLEDPVSDLQSHSDSRTYVHTSVTLENTGQNS